MGDRLQTLALGAVNVLAILSAFAVLCFLAWLLIATVRHHAGRGAKRRERIAQHKAARAAAKAALPQDLRHIRVSDIDFDAELRNLTKEIDQ